MIMRWFAFATLCLWGVVALAEERWATYLNPRFGAAADYPADLFTVQAPPPDNGDGQTFRTADGRAELAIYGSYNIDDERPEAYLAHNVNLGDVTYKKIGSDFYAVSGTHGETIYYERCNFPNHDVLSCFYISYPPRRRPSGTRSWRASGDPCISLRPALNSRHGNRPWPPWRRASP